jgi:hypothetical protein
MPPTRTAKKVGAGAESARRTSKKNVGKVAEKPTVAVPSIVTASTAKKKGNAKRSKTTAVNTSKKPGHVFPIEATRKDDSRSRQKDFGGMRTPEKMKRKVRAPTQPQKRGRPRRGPVLGAQGRAQTELTSKSSDGRRRSTRGARARPGEEVHISFPGLQAGIDITVNSPRRKSKNAKLVFLVELSSELEEGLPDLVPEGDLRLQGENGRGPGKYSGIQQTAVRAHWRSQHRRIRCRALAVL